MANEEQVKRLLAGVEGWNKWRKENPDLKIDLSRVNLWTAHLSGVNFAEANLEKTLLVDAWLEESNLQGANLQFADLGGARLNHSCLERANLVGADLSGAYLVKADLRRSDLMLVNFTRAAFREAKIGGANINTTSFVSNNLSQVGGLEDAIHTQPSYIDLNTLWYSGGNIPEKFLRGCGLSDWEIESTKLYQPGLSTKEIDDILYRVHDLRAGRAVQINPLFISYSHKDNVFVDAMENHLNNKGIRFWRDIHHATAGKLEKVVDRAMRQNPTVLIVLSEHSVQSDWVEHEARSARELEKELKRDVLCPVALDEAWKNCNWPARLREQIMEYNILDFSNWNDEAEFTRKFAKLVEGLDLFYKEK